MQGEKEVAIDQAGSNQPPDSRVQKNESLLNKFALPPHPILDNFFLPILSFLPASLALRSVGFY